MSSIYEVRAARLNEFLKTRAGLNSLFDVSDWPGGYKNCSVEQAIELKKIEWGCYPACVICCAKS